MAGKKKRKSRKPFTPLEVKTLLSEVEPHHDILFGDQHTRRIQKESIWKDVVAAVYSVSHTVRTVQVLRTKYLASKPPAVTATGGGPSNTDESGDTDNTDESGDTDTDEQESAVGGEEDDDAGEGPSAAGHPAAPTPSTKPQSAGRVLTDAVLQRETIDAVKNLTEEMRQIRNVITEIATILKDTVKK
ncbi:unnamed protein product [Boreogadus saida]